MNESLELALLQDRKDEEQIIAEMKGQLLKSYVYTIQQGSTKITNLSYAGVKEAIRRRGNMSVWPCQCCQKPVHIEETADDIRALVTMYDLKNNVKVVGASSAMKKQPFAFVLAVNKAERNAMRKLLPEAAIALLIQEYLRQQNGPAIAAKPTLD